MRKSRILILTGIFEGEIGGPGTQLDPLIRELIKNGYRVKVLTFGQRDKSQYPYPIESVSHYWPYFLKGFVFLIKGLFSALRADVLYNQDLYTAGLASLIIKKILGKPLVTRFVGESAWETAISRGWTKDDIISFQKKKYNWQIELRKRIRKKILTDSDKIIAVSYFLKDLAQKIGLPAEKIKVIYNSIDFLKERPSLPSKEELKQKFDLSGKVLLANARLTPWKGVDMLIKIMPRLVEGYSRINLIVIGQGPELSNLKRLTKELNLESNVFFVGKVSRQKVVDYLGAADLFVLNTSYEGMSHCLLEAMKIGCPIVTTPAGGNPETIKNGQTGLLVGYNNKEEWLEAISSILDNPDLAQRLVNQAKEDLKRFSWPKLVQETIKVFKGCR